MFGILIIFFSGIIRSDYVMEYSREIGFLLGGHKLSLSVGIVDTKTVLKVSQCFLRGIVDIFDLWGFNQAESDLEMHRLS